MNEKKLVEYYLDMERNNVFAYAANYKMDVAKPGYEREFQEARERVTLLEELLLAQG